MSTKKISELNESLEINDDDLLVMVDVANVVTKKIKAKNMIKKIFEENIGVDEYSSLQVYNLGDYCIYENILYRCIETTSLGEDFDDSKWIETTITDEFKEIDITDSITFNEEIVENATRFMKTRNMVFVNYQGANTSHSVGNVLANIPEDYRPKYTTHAPITGNGNGYGTVVISAITGEMKIDQFSGTVTGRIYANFSYLLI